MTERRFNATLAALPIGYLVLAFTSTTVDRPFFWGINHLRYYPGWVWVLGGAVLLLVALPQVRERVLSLPIPSVAPRTATLCLVVLGTACFVLARDTTHLLGDGYLLPRELGKGFRKIANEPLTIWIINRTYGLVKGFGVSSDQVYTLFSVVSGAGFLCLLPGLCRRLVGEPGRSFTVVMLVVAPAYLQLFFGYHETYPILYPLMLVYIWLSFEAIDGRVPSWIPGLVLGLLVALHFTMATIALSFVVVLAPSGHIRDRVKTMVGRSYEIVPGVALFALAMWVTGFNLDTYSRQASADTFLPILFVGQTGAPYGAFSVTHAFEFANQLMLVYLPALLLVPFAWKSVDTRDFSAFLLLAAIPSFIATFFGFTVIGAFRDWDALAFPAIFVALFLSMHLVRSVPRPRSRHVLLVAGSVGAFQTALFVAINVESARAADRYEDALVYASMSDRARSYGWETIGSHYMAIGEMDKASLAYEHAMEIDPSHPRYPSSLGVILMQSGDFERAARSFERAVALDDKRPETLVNLSLSKLQLGAHNEAIQAIRKAWVLDEDSARIPFVLGVAYYAKSEYQKAIGAYLASLRVDPRNADAHLNIAQLYGLVSDNERKSQHLKRVLEYRPNHSQREEISAWLVWYADQN